MAYLHYRTQTLIRTPKPMATLHYAEVFTLHGVRFRFQAQLPTKGMGFNHWDQSPYPQSVSVNINEPYN